MSYSQLWANHFANYNESFNEGLSIIDLVNSGTLDCKLAALLWLVMEQRASVLVASLPVFAGKTTLMHAILDFLPPELEMISIKGYFEDFKFLNHSKPAKTYLVSEEISNHGFSEYLWGLKAVKTFRLLSEGYNLGATMHARTSEEALLILYRVLGIPLSLISRLGIIVNLRATAGLNEEDDPIRQVISVDLVLPDKEGLAIQVLAARQSENGFDYQNDKTLQQALTGKNLVGKYDIKAEIASRERFLRQLQEKGLSSRPEFRKAVAGYYGSKAE